MALLPNFVDAQKVTFAPLQGWVVTDTVTNSKSMAYSDLLRLEHSVLVVYLKTYRKKIAYLKSAVKNKPKSKRMKKLLRQTLEKSQQQQRAIVEAYTNHYQFSDVLFLPDTLAPLLLDGQKEGIFVSDTSLTIDETARLPLDSFYICYIGTPPTATSTGAESLIIANSNNEMLPSPFPYATMLATYGKWSLIGSIGVKFRSGSDAAITQTVKKQQQRLEKFQRKFWKDYESGKVMIIEE